MKIHMVTCVFVLLNSISCASRVQHKNLKADLFRVQKRLLHLEEQQGVKGGDIDGVREQVASGDTRFQEIEQTLRLLHGEVDMLKVAVRRGGVPGEAIDPSSLLGRVESIEASLQQVGEKVSAGKKEDVVSSDQSASGQSYSSLNRAFHDKRYEEVLSGIPKYFTGSHAKGSRYLKAESLYRLKRWSEAALAFHELLEMKPSDKVLPHVRMRMGDCFRRMGKSDAARVYYKELLENHPKSSEAKLAKKSLSRLQKVNKKG
ncbi:MAG: tol-pal system YbgF family protein [Oligoflexales bacterium]